MRLKSLTHNEIKSIRDKDEFLIPFINALTDPEFKTGTLETGSTITEISDCVCMHYGRAILSM